MASSGTSDPYLAAADRIEAADRDRYAVTAWRAGARAEQQPPQPGTRTTYLRGGRGSGKSWAAGHIFAEWISEPTAVGEWAVVSPTFADARSMAIESPDSGLLAALGTSRQQVDAGQSKTVAAWNRSLGELTLRSGVRVYATGADNGAIRLQGKNLRGVWADEIGLWVGWQVAWDESIRMSTRLAGARIVATGTPKSTRLSRKLVKRLIEDPKVDNRLLKTLDNREHLDATFLEDVTSGLTGRLSRQELEGELLDAPEGALFLIDHIDAARVDEAPDLDVVVVAVDPAVTSNEDSDETGIIVAGKGRDGHAYVLADLSCRAHPAEVARRVIAAHHDYRANWVVAEVNNGGDYIGALLRTVDPNVGYRVVHATRGKALRAEPVAAVYERGRAHHVGRLETLEGQMTQYEPGQPDSPDRLDALVWAVVALKVSAGSMTWDEVYAVGQPADGGEHAANPWAEAYGMNEQTQGRP